MMPSFFFFLYCSSWVLIFLILTHAYVSNLDFYSYILNAYTNTFNFHVFTHLPHFHLKHHQRFKCSNVIFWALWCFAENCDCLFVSVLSPLQNANVFVNMNFFSRFILMHMLCSKINKEYCFVSIQEYQHKIIPLMNISILYWCECVYEK